MMFGWLKREKWPTFSSEEIRKRARILIIDDQDFAYLPLFEKDSYTIEKWNDVSDLQKLESGYFDLILLDVQGVGRQQTAEEGLGILKHLHKASPAQIVIAYSSADFSLRYQEFFKLADATLDKSADYVDFKRAVDAQLKRRFSIDFYLDRIVARSNPEFTDTEKLRSAARTAISKGNVDVLESFLAKVGEKAELVEPALKIAKAAIAIKSIFI